MSTQHELVGRLLDDRHTGIVYRVAAVNPGAFPIEMELDLKPEHVRSEEPGDPHGRSVRSKERRDNLSSGTGHQSISWVGFVRETTEEKLRQLRSDDP